MSMLVKAQEDGKVSLCLGFLLLIGSGVLAMWMRWPVFVILLTAGGIGAVFGVGRKALDVRRQALGVGLEKRTDDEQPI